MNKFGTKLAVLLMALVLLVGSLPMMAFAAPYAQETDYELDYIINNPYASVDWVNFTQYKADFHAHSTNSDGGNLTSEMVEDHYAKGYDILAMTDHNYTTRGWENADKGALSLERKQEIEAGVGRDGRGMLDFSYSNEQSRTDHINSFLVDFNNQTFPSEMTSTERMADTLAKVEALGGFSHINHMGRYTGARGNGYTDTAPSYDPANINKYTYLLQNYPSCVGMEIINKIDGESRFDRILWDNILMALLPQGRQVWGLSNDDTHSLNATGYSFNMMLMPELSIDATRWAMENGTFYAVSRVSRLDGINATYPDGSEMRGSGNTSTLYLLDQTTPSISNIVVDQTENSLYIEGADYHTIEWIADGQVIATGNMIDLNDYEDVVNSYVRAQLKSDTGIAFTQPFSLQVAQPETIEILNVSTKNKQANIDFPIISANGKGYRIYLSTSGIDGDYQAYDDVNFNKHGAHIRGLDNGQEYYAYIVYVENNVITQRSQPVKLVPGK